MNTYGPEYKVWLDSLKVGDKVCSVGTVWSHNAYTVYLIKKITPTRKFIIVNAPCGTYEIKLGSDGHTTRSGYERFSIEPITPELRWEKRKRIMIGRLNDFDWKIITDEELKQVYTLVSKFTEKVLDENDNT